MLWNAWDIRRMTEAELEETFLMLDDRKREKIEKIRQKKDKILSLTAERMARDMLARELDTTPSLVQFTYTPLGKPLVVSQRPVYFNVSHAGNLAVCAVSQKPVGIDVEIIRDVPPKLAKKFFSHNEQTYIFAKPFDKIDWDMPMNQAELMRFFEVWTAKEAYLKCSGEGIAHLKSLDTTPFRFERHLLSDEYIVTIYQEKYSLF
ncbi:MAG: 4'-phosphopantetheinyl transferase superfamily protein [Clostridia bacterium]|nr:4'-phosphopantetheinyl transferase superfamily protein [Clostridia bacterium]